jgi:hypothetical protein
VRSAEGPEVGFDIHLPSRRLGVAVRSSGVLLRYLDSITFTNHAGKLFDRDDTSVGDNHVVEPLNIHKTNVRVLPQETVKDLVVVDLGLCGRWWKCRRRVR